MKRYKFVSVWVGLAYAISSSWAVAGDAIVLPAECAKYEGEIRAGRVDEEIQNYSSKLNTLREVGGWSVAIIGPIGIGGMAALSTAAASALVVAGPVVLAAGAIGVGAYNIWKARQNRSRNECFRIARAIQMNISTSSSSDSRVNQMKAKPDIPGEITKEEVERRLREAGFPAR